MVGYIKSLLILLLLVSCSDTEAQKQIPSITGKISDAETNQPLVGVPIYLVGSKFFAISKEGGDYELLGIEPGRYQITAASQGYTPRNDSVTVGNRELVVNLSLTPKKGEEEKTAAARDRKLAVKKKNLPSASDRFKTTCDCHEAGTKALDEAIKLRKTFSSAEEMYENVEAVERLEQILKNWESEQEVCLVKFGTRLLVETECNSPDEISLKKHTLDFLGVNL